VLNSQVRPFRSERFSALAIEEGGSCSGVLRDRQAAVDTVLELNCGEPMERKDAPATLTDQPRTEPNKALKRYRNE
jgi:hypothetical protein